MTDLTLATTQELVDEIKTRFDQVIIAVIDKEKVGNDLVHEYWMRGDMYSLLGLMDVVKLTIKREMINALEDCDLLLEEADEEEEEEP
jgi:hypothetical protein